MKRPLILRNSIPTGVLTGAVALVFVGILLTLALIPAVTPASVYGESPEPPGQADTPNEDGKDQTPPGETKTPPAQPVQFPLVATGYTFTQDEDIGTKILPEAEGGAGGFSYSLSPGLPEGLSFDPASRALTGAPAAAGDFPMTYTATDADGLTGTAKFNITGDRGFTAALATASAAPVFGSGPTTRSVAENSPAGTAVGDPVTATYAGSDTLTYSLSGSDKFSVDSATGQIRVAEGALLDYDTTQSYTVTVSVTDGVDSDGNDDTTADDTITVTISVTKEYRPPGKPDAPTVAPSSTHPKTALDVSWTAPDNTGLPAITHYNLRYGEQGTDFSSWSSQRISGGATSATISDLLPGTTYEVKVQAVGETTGSWSDAGSGTTEKSPPPEFGGTHIGRSVAENSPAGTDVGRPVDADYHGAATLTYSLSGSDKFVVDSATGQIRVAQGAALDYETTRSYDVTMSVTDGMDADGNSEDNPAADSTIIVNIRLSNVAEATIAITGPEGPLTTLGRFQLTFLLHFEDGIEWKDNDNVTIGWINARTAGVSITQLSDGWREEHNVIPQRPGGDTGTGMFTTSAGANWGRALRGLPGQCRWTRTRRKWTSADRRRRRTARSKSCSP